MKTIFDKKIKKLLAAICFIAMSATQCCYANDQEPVLQSLCPITQFMDIFENPDYFNFYETMNNDDQQKKLIDPSLVIVTTKLPTATQEVYYEFWLDYTYNGLTKPRWSSDGLPDGLYIDSDNGIIYGVPKITGEFVFTTYATIPVKIKLTDEFTGLSFEKELTIYIQNIEERLNNLTDNERDFYSYFASLEGSEGSEVKKKFLRYLRRLDELKRNIKRCSGPLLIENRDIILNNLEKASYDEKILISDILDLIEEYTYSHTKYTNELSHQRNIMSLMNDFFEGGHIVFKDKDAHLYKKWIKFKRNLVTRKNISSHQSIDEQFAIRGDFVKEALFGTRLDEEGNKYTWIQLERHPGNIWSLWSIIPHMYTFVKYKLNGKNIGPYGESKYIEADPLEILTSSDYFLACHE